MAYMIKSLLNISHRIYELDIIRVVAATSIILTHLWFFYPIDRDFRSFFYILGTAGPTVFFFLSGFFVARVPLATKQDVCNFWKKKFIRILPAMYVAILFYVLIESLNLGSPAWDTPLNIWSVLTNLLCLQVFFYDLRFFAFWYIGALFILYLIHICVQQMSRGDVKKYALFSVLLFIPIILLYFIDLPIYGFGYETRLIEYYFVFFFGSLSGLSIIDKKTNILPYLLEALFGIILIHVIANTIGFNYRLIQLSNLPVFITMLALTLFLYIVDRGVYSPISSVPKFIQKASYGTYSTYLFHYPILCLLAATGIQNQYAFICISVPLVFIIAYMLQRIIDYLLSKLTNRYPLLHKIMCS